MTLGFSAGWKTKRTARRCRDAMRGGGRTARGGNDSRRIIAPQGISEQPADAAPALCAPLSQGGDQTLAAQGFDGGCGGAAPRPKTGTWGLIQLVAESGNAIRVASE